MGKVKYDGFQLAKRHKIAYQTLIMLLALVWINGYVKSSYGVWAEPYLESLVLIYIPGFYFAGRSIWLNAYIRANDRPSMPILMIILTGFIGVLGFLSLGSPSLQEHSTLLKMASWAANRSLTDVPLIYDNVCFVGCEKVCKSEIDREVMALLV